MTNFSCLWRRIFATGVAGGVLVVTLGLTKPRDAPEPQPFQQRSNNDASLASLSQQPLPEAPLLVRCTWAGPSHQEGGDQQPPPLPFVSCPKDVCSHQNSHSAYGQFLFHQALSAERKSSNQEKYNTTLRHFVHDPVQCLFLTTNWQDMCHCHYTTFVDYCHNTHYSNQVNVTLVGDSTAMKFQKNVINVCQSHVARPTSPTRQESAREQVQTATTTNVVVVNDATLHRLYLPFYRETDVPTKSGHDKWLHTPPTSIPDFWRVLDERLQEQVNAAHDDPSTLFFYMANNEVCHDAYTDQYAHAVNFLYENPNPNRMARVQGRRGGNEVATWGLTLDYYGSHLAQELSRIRVAERFPQFAYFSLDATYPANCLLTHDGRHFYLPGYDIEVGVSYYTAKARILWHLIQSRLPEASVKN